jgi:hypothetical protein
MAANDKFAAQIIANLKNIALDHIDPDYDCCRWRRRRQRLPESRELAWPIISMLNDLDQILQAAISCNYKD